MESNISSVEADSGTVDCDEPLRVGRLKVLAADGCDFDPGLPNEVAADTGESSNAV
jgi:hypothetical protein